MKTLVKYLPDNRGVTLHIPARPYEKAVRMFAGDATKHGFGDHTVQEDGKTVLCHANDISKLDFFLKRV